MKHLSSSQCDEFGDNYSLLYLYAFDAQISLLGLSIQCSQHWIETGIHIVFEFDKLDDRYYPVDMANTNLFDRIFGKHSYKEFLDFQPDNLDDVYDLFYTYTDIELLDDVWESCVSYGCINEEHAAENGFVNKRVLRGCNKDTLLSMSIERWVFKEYNHDYV